MRMQMWMLLLAIPVLVLQTSCKIDLSKLKKDKIEIVHEDSPPPAPPVFHCTISLDVSLAKIDEDIIVRVTGHDGVAPYKIDGTTATFAATTVLSKKFDSAGSKSGTVTVSDNAGAKTTCNFAVRILEDEADTTDLACTISPSIASPHINETTSFEMVASGGTAPYTFESFSAPGSTVAANLTASSATKATAQAKFSTSGAKTATAQLKDDNGDTVSCAHTLTVRPTLAVFLSASSSSQSADQSITLTATTEGFLSTATTTYEFSTTESGITLTPTGNTVAVKSNVNVSHTNFVVTVKAKSSNGEEATGNINLNFVPSLPLNCQLVHPLGLYVAGSDPVTFTVSSSGEQVEFVTFDAGTGATVTAPTPDTRKVVFSTGGWKTVSTTAKSRTRSTLCNNGSTMQKTVKINNALACSAYSSPNPTRSGQVFNVWAVVPAETGAGSSRVIDVRTLTTASAGFYQWTGPMSAQIYFWSTGSFPVELVVEDAAGRTTICTTTQVVYP